MNIDDLKDAWNQDEPLGMHLSVGAAVIGETTSAIGKIRKNMKREFIATLVTYLMMLSFLFSYQHNPFFFIAASSLIFSLMIPNGFFFFRFYVFYKSISRYDLNLKKSIRKMAYELELNIELYKSYNICITPLAVLIVFGLACGKKTFDVIQHVMSNTITVSPWTVLLILSVILISYIITYACITWSVRCMYGKYLAELKKIVDDLDTED